MDKGGTQIDPWTRQGEQICCRLCEAIVYISYNLNEKKNEIVALQGQIIESVKKNKISKMDGSIISQVNIIIKNHICLKIDACKHSYSDGVWLCVSVCVCVCIYVCM